MSHFTAILLLNSLILSDRNRYITKWTILLCKRKYHSQQRKWKKAGMKYRLGLMAY